MQIATRLRWPRSVGVSAWVSTLASVAVSVAAADSPPTPLGRDFCADIVTRDSSGAPTGTVGKLYAANGKVRIETSSATAGFFLTDGTTATALFVRPQQRVFMDARQSTPLTRIFLPVNPNDPCVQWQAGAKASGLVSAAGDWQCKLTESAGVDSAHIEYTVTAPDQQNTQAWIAPDLAFPVKWRAADGTTFALEHIRVDTQPPELFAVPSDYRKSDPQALIERIKHSDVWAAPPQ